MSTSLRFWFSASLAAIGSLGVYVGSFVNAMVLGSTLGYVLILPGIVLIGAAPFPIKALPLQKWRSVFILVLRYLSVPVFLLGATMLAPTLIEQLSARGGQVHGIYFATFLTVAGLFAIAWPELRSLIHWSCRRRPIDA
jgi:hypothetical protein